MTLSTAVALGISMFLFGVLASQRSDWGFMAVAVMFLVVILADGDL